MQTPAALQSAFCLISMKPSTALAPHTDIGSVISTDTTIVL